MDPIVTSAASLTKIAMSNSNEPQVDLMRNLVSMMLNVNTDGVATESPQQDHPFYVGLATSLPKESANTSPFLTLPSNGKLNNLPDSLGVKTDDTLVDVSSTLSKNTQEPLKNIYKTPTIDEQLKLDVKQIVVDRKIIDQQISGDTSRSVSFLIEERVIDRKYLEYSHLSNIITEIRHGNIPTIRQAFLALVDLTDKMTFKIFHPYLTKFKLEDAQFRVRLLSADLDAKQVSTVYPEMSSQRTLLSKDVYERKFLTDKVVEEFEVTDTKIRKHLDIAVLNIQDVCSVEMSEKEKDILLGKINGSADFKEILPSAQIENIFLPEKIASIEKSAMAWTRERLATETADYTVKHEFSRYFTDLKGFLGEKITESEKAISINEQMKYSEYLSASDNINLQRIESFDDAYVSFSKLDLTQSNASAPISLDKYTEAASGAAFKDGWITYLPGGSLVNLGIKKDFGSEITGMDLFWAGVDVATGALAVVTFGTSTVFVAPSKVATAGVGKAIVKGGAEAVLKGGSKNVISQGLQGVVKPVTQTSSKVVEKYSGDVVISSAEKGVKGQVTTLTKLPPKEIIQVGDFAYKTDEKGRVISASGMLKNIPGQRDPLNQKLAAQMGELGDEGGHLIPARFGGPGDLLNHVPQTKNVNRSVVKKIENELGRELGLGKEVKYTIMPHYSSGNTLRPDKFTIRYEIDGVQKIRRISNV